MVGYDCIVRNLIKLQEKFKFYCINRYIIKRPSRSIHTVKLAESKDAIDAAIQSAESLIASLLDRPSASHAMPSEVRVRALVIPSRMAFTDRNPLNIYVDISAMCALNSCGVDYYTLGSLLCVASTLGFHVVCVLSGHTMRGRVPSGLNREIPLISYIC